MAHQRNRSRIKNLKKIGDLIIEIRSATAGVGTFTAKFDHMAELTGRPADQIVAAKKAAAQAAA